jgi:hypothetical protein
MRGACVFAILSLAFLASPLAAQSSRNIVSSARTAVKPDFVFPEKNPVRIILFRPDIEVNEETVGGLDQPKADWSKQARLSLLSAMESEKIKRSFEFVQMDELTGKDAGVAEDYRSLFKVVINAAVEHKLFPGNKLPSKASQFNWTLGSGANQLAKNDAHNYGLYLFSYDSFPSAARSKSAVIGSLMGEGEARGQHYGYAALVDLKSGDMVWINVDLKMRGDPRNPLGAAKRISELLSGFPTRKSGAAPGKSK